MSTLPASLRRILEQRNAGTLPEVTTIWRDGTVIRNGIELRSLDPLPHSFKGTTDDPFPHD